MEANVGGFDRTARLMLGSLLVVFGVGALADILSLGTVVGAVALVIGLVFLATGMTRLCLLYQVVGVDTCRRR
ncbi:DUF2892 domain-containing protein [Natribaculum luteum]|uniref:DUF2892 domain-containing protein n=1 Tax=Natribaculum luteum TaxID=1586232 RepID=A0ABD5NXQ2_9EURY|nr:DUF2892 domain-containing protein [Natribaculum luteum]